MRILLRATLIGLVITMPLVVAAQTASPNTLKELVALIVNLLNRATGVLVALALVVFLFGAAVNTMKASERGSTELRKFFVWGIGILFVMVSIWGILRLLQNTLFGTGANQSTDPRTSAAWMN